MELPQHLIKACIKGDRIAQKALFDTYAPRMLALCFRYTKAGTDAEEILQEGFVRVFTYLAQYRGEGELGAWIRQVMVSTALNFLKRNANYRSLMVFDKTDLHAVSEENPEFKLTAKEICSLVQQLPIGYQTIFNLYAIEGYTHVEIGKMLGITDSTSRSQYARARALLLSWMTNTHSQEKMNNYAR